MFLVIPIACQLERLGQGKFNGKSLEDRTEPKKGSPLSGFANLCVSIPSPLVSFRSSCLTYEVSDRNEVYLCFCLNLKLLARDTG